MNVCGQILNQKLKNVLKINIKYKFKTWFQVYSTEKYLYEKAKRKVCFLISRKGPTENAVVVCQGAMREDGKLILNLDEDMLIDLIMTSEPSRN